MQNEHGGLCRLLEDGSGWGRQADKQVFGVRQKSKQVCGVVWCGSRVWRGRARSIPAAIWVKKW